MGVIWAIIVGLIMGLILGPLARMIIPGKQDISLLGTVLVGAGAAILGGIIAGWLASENPRAPTGSSSSSSSAGGGRDPRLRHSIGQQVVVARRLMPFGSTVEQCAG